MKKPFIVTITGPSCAGKSTLESLLKERGFESVISTTTRPPRDGEQTGVNYYFVSKERFERDKVAGLFVETTEFSGNLYGVTRGEIERLAAIGTPIVVVVEPNGREQIQDFAERAGWDVYSVFVTNPIPVILRRFMARFTGEVSRMGIFGEYEKLINNYTQRLVTMITTERGWHFEADHDNYNLVLGSFDESNTSGVVDQIVTKAHSVMKSRGIAVAA